jgi:hypothetical protein
LGAQNKSIEVENLALAKAVLQLLEGKVHKIV